MGIQINYNNITSGIISGGENRLNIKYAINSTWKSTVAKAIEYAAVYHENGKFFMLYVYIGTADTKHIPSL